MTNVPRTVTLAGVLSLAVFSAPNCVQQEAVPAEFRELRERGDVAEIQTFAEQGNANAQFLLALMYDSGAGVPQDFVQVHVWYTITMARIDDQ